MNESHGTDDGSGATARVAISGASGLIGSTLATALEADGHVVRKMVRRRGEAGIFWDWTRGEIDAAALGQVDAVVHLAGRGIADGRWSEENKRLIRDSRVHGTRLLAEALAALPRRPRVLVNASAVGYYGDRGEQALDESSPAGAGFLADVCVEWERACAPAEEAGMRVVKLRTGVVLDHRGGALPRMLTPFRLGLGGKLGDGRQYMSWIGLADLVRAIRRALDDPAIRGPLNTVAPTPVTNAEFTRALGRVLRRPTVLTVPAFAIRLLLGEMGRSTLLASTRAVPGALTAGGFRFDHPTVESALRHTLSC